MSLLAMLVVVASIVMAVFHYWQRDAEFRKDPAALRPFIIWGVQGLVAPILIWTFFNCGLVVSPLIPAIGQAYAAGSWVDAFLPYTAVALFVIASWWAAITFALLAARAMRRSESRRETFTTAGIWLVVALPLSALIAGALGLSGSGFALALCLAAVTHASMPDAPIKVGPTYSRAMAKIAFDKFNEAEMEIIKQLEQQENDFDGWMLLAELYATHFNDLKSAERTVCELCDDPATTPPQVAIALNRLADWHLKLAENPDHARWALEQIRQRLPGTHMALMAERRLEHLPKTKEEIARHRSAPTIKLQPSSPLPLAASAEAAAGLSAPTIKLAAPQNVNPRAAARAEAESYSERLRHNPSDMEARFAFAEIMAEKLDQPDIGIEQLELMLQMPGAAESERLRWLTRLAEWHLNLRHDPEQARLTFGRIIADYPQTHAAFEAQRRLYVLGIEAAARQRRKSGAQG